MRVDESRVKDEVEANESPAYIDFQTLIIDPDQRICQVEVE